jgi:hypothetical protein
VGLDSRDYTKSSPSGAFFLLQVLPATSSAGRMGGAKRYPSTKICENDGFREGRNPSRYFVLMVSSDQKRRFPAPWRAQKVTPDCYEVRDANGFRLLTIYCRDDLQKWSFGSEHLTSDEVRRLAVAIARIPEFLKSQPQFAPRRIYRRGRYWRSSHPYQVAIREAYINENRDEMIACCAYNNVPYNPTGEILDRIGIRWRTFEFERQFDAIRFWAKFDGRWMVGDGFHFPEQPKDLPLMVSLPRRGFGKRPPTR